MEQHLQDPNCYCWIAFQHPDGPTWFAAYAVEGSEVSIGEDGVWSFKGWRTAVRQKKLVPKPGTEVSESLAALKADLCHPLV